jgi:hypothetical protein
MIVSFRIKKKDGTITSEKGNASVDFPDKETASVLEDRLNSVQNITFKGIDMEGSERMTVVSTVPCYDDGNLVNFLNQGVPGIKGKIIITGIEGSEKVTFTG